MIEGTNAQIPEESSGGGPTVVIPDFIGPLDLLLHLIHKNRFSIFDIPISVICDQYQEHLRAMQSLVLEMAGEFLWMASWLLHLKSRTLLPRPSADQEGEDTRQELVERLLEYRRVKEVASALYDADIVRRCLWEPDVGVKGIEIEPELDWEDVDLRRLAGAYLEVMERFASTHPPPLEVTPLKFKVEDKMRDLYERVQKEKMLPLLRFLDNRLNSEEVVALVVATLELVRLGGVCADQSMVFAEIYLRPGPKIFDPEVSFRQNCSEERNGH
ncbi:MAG: segregation/condensation protein A [Thermoanaerobaculales bacterium]|nr:segregation/condensation protein A [Thermoanaerobaculales bacterium]